MAFYSQSDRSIQRRPWGESRDVSWIYLVPVVLFDWNTILSLFSRIIPSFFFEDCSISPLQILPVALTASWDRHPQVSLTASHLPSAGVLLIAPYHSHVVCTDVSLSQFPLDLYISVLKKLKTLCYSHTCIYVFIAAHLIIAKSWKWPICPLMDDWLKKM